MAVIRKLLYVVLAVLLCCFAPAVAKVEMPRFDLEAHRGGRDLRPENTLASFRHALEIGVTTLEMDVQITRDGVPMLSHNAMLSASVTRDPHGEWVRPGHEPIIHQLTLAEVKRYDVGGINPGDKEYFADHGKLQRVSPGERMPTLDEMFDMVERFGDRRVRFNIETKSYAFDTAYRLNPDPCTFTRIVLGVIKKHHMEKRCMIQSFDWRTLLEARRLDKDVTTVALTSEIPDWGDEGWYRHVGEPGCSIWMAGLDIDDYAGDYVKAAHVILADVISPYYGELNRGLVDEAHGFGMKVVPWTVNKRADMERMIDMGVDGVISDRPDLLKRVVVERGLPH